MLADCNGGWYVEVIVMVGVLTHSDSNGVRTNYSG